MDWSNLSEVADWSDLSKMIESGGESSGAKKSSTTGQLGAAKANMKGAGQRGDAGRDKLKDSMPKPQEDHLENFSVGGWTDMKQFDDDHDPDWFDEEEMRLAKIYGGHFIKVKYTEQGRPGYFCELCLAEMNAKKSLEAHCEGMKHLKKKALWEKNSGGEPEPPLPLEGRKGGWSDNMLPFNRDHGSHMRDRSPLRGHRDMHSPPRGRGRGREFGMPDSRMDGRLGFRPNDGPLRGRGGGPPDDRYHDPINDRIGSSNDRFVMPDGGPGNGAPHDQRGGHFQRPPPPAVPLAAPSKEKLSGGTTGLLLTKLASCYIKDEEDADLALNVVSSLASSLREYNTKKGEKKIAELLMEAELKLNTLKALKVGLKLLGNKQAAGQAASGAASVPVAARLGGPASGGSNGMMYPPPGGISAPPPPQYYPPSGMAADRGWGAPPPVAPGPPQYPKPPSHQYAAPSSYSAPPRYNPGYGRN